ncbi:Gfo/Idh/MocA family oxidoreductase [Microbispora hainanensis]|uniref:Gfo/Idh/MocA family oxidoreductase n=1 Tax=Microbispora hainanensis TaxID=568844 RepID=A0ABZ1SRH4_9ACTN|nr:MULTISPECIES: Gfo/Idh/MocA family oxidoreductase [Microbispora]NJP22639.1 Gfo/Idh/MocA family oxidoreductase [Microbispora sp. CL1-1]TQS16692.1 Gfo/Idh/MocA family oxidoreductase [Microbispora sp. SCL1-1]
MEPVRVGLVGAGPWAEMVHAPALAAGPHTTLSGVWARRPEAARALADAHGAPAFERLEDLFAASEAVAFCVPPTVQAELGVLAARAGKALLLEKPLAADLDGARRLAGAIEEAGVASQMLFTFRYSAATAGFLERARRIEPFGGHAANISGSLRGGPFATPWRLERGAVLDVGPHTIDLLDAALGRVVGVKAHGDPLGWVGLLLEHEGGAVSEASLSMAVEGETPPSRVDVYGRLGTASLLGSELGDVFPEVVRQFASTVRDGGGHPLDARHGLRMQEIIDDVERQLRAG